MSHFGGLHFRNSWVGRTCGRPGGKVARLVAELNAFIGELAQVRAGLRRSNVRLLESVPQLGKHQVTLSATAPDQVVDMVRRGLVIMALRNGAGRPWHETPPFGCASLTQRSHRPLSAVPKRLGTWYCAVRALRITRDGLFCFPRCASVPEFRRGTRARVPLPSAALRPASPPLSWLAW